MTREEAIKEWIIPALKNTWNEKKNAEILKALEQEPCEDAISRAEVLDLIDSKDPDYKVIHFKEDVECLDSVSTEKIERWEMSETQLLDDIASGKLKEPYTCVSIRVGNEIKHCCVVNCSSLCHNPSFSCERNKDACPNCGARVVDESVDELVDECKREKLEAEERGY